MSPPGTERHASQARAARVMPPALKAALVGEHRHALPSPSSLDELVGLGTLTTQAVASLDATVPPL